MAWLMLDLGWTFGWCQCRSGGLITSGFVNLKHGNVTDGAPVGQAAMVHLDAQANQ